MTMARTTSLSGSSRNISNGWFTETDSMWSGQKFSLALEELSEKSILHNEHSSYQSIVVFRSAQYGNVLVLDGVIQLTERDEFAYHEMMAHLPLFSHTNPKRVLIVGGGDGGVLSQVCRHDCLEHITVVEIDPAVVRVAKQYFGTASAFDDPRVQVVHQDGSEFMQECIQEFDVILADTLDPIGPGESLFQPAFYESMHRALRNGGIVCAQSECFWINLDLISDVVTCCREIFDSAEYASTFVPSFPCGQTGFVLARKGKPYTCQKPARLPSLTFSAQLRWYNTSFHQASFVLPEFVREQLATDHDAGDCLLQAPCTIL